MAFGLPDPGALAAANPTNRRTDEAVETRYNFPAMECLPGSALPERLAAIPDPPNRLYVRGGVGVLDAPAVAIVGSRRATRAGRDFAHALARELASGGLVVVSGLAYGIDAAAHRGALASGRTIAVLGSGLDRVYPRAHEGLARDIVAAGGAVVTEYAPDAGPRKHRFPERNRLISGLALGVVIVEATTRSGSLITARMAAEQGREVMAVPGPVASPLAGGCHRLLKSGAALIENADDVLFAIGYERADTPSAPPPMPPDDLKVLLEFVGAETTTLDRIVGATGLSPEAASEALVQLELLGFVAAHRGGYIRAFP